MTQYVYDFFVVPEYKTERDKDSSLIRSWSECTVDTKLWHFTDKEEIKSDKGINGLKREIEEELTKINKFFTIETNEQDGIYNFTITIDPK